MQKKAVIDSTNLKQAAHLNKPNLGKPSLFKLAACFIYDTLVVAAICLMSATVFILLIGDATHGLKRYALQLFLWLIVGAYFVWCWHKTGQTLAMQTWRLKVVNKDNQLLIWPILLKRYVLATMSLMFLGLGFLWAFVDRDRLYLHDRILASKIVYMQG